MARYDASINLVVNGSSKLDQVFNKATQLQGIIDSIAKTPLEISAKKAISEFDKFDSELKAAQATIANQKKTIDSTSNSIEKYIDSIAKTQGQLNKLNPNTKRYNEVLRRQQDAISGLAEAQQTLAKSESDLARAQNTADEAGKRVKGAKAARDATVALSNLADEYLRLGAAQQKGQKGQPLANQLAPTIAQLKAQADALGLVADNSRVASNQFNSFTVASQLAGQKIFEARQKQLKALAAGFSAEGPQVSFGTSIAASRSAVGNLIGSYSEITKSEAALSAYAEQLRSLQSIVPYASNEFSALEEALAGVNEEIAKIGKRGQKSPIQAALGPATNLGSVRAFTQREAYEKKVNDELARQASVEEKINRATISETQATELRNRLEEAASALAENRLDDAKRITREIEEQRKSMERFNRSAQLARTGKAGIQTFGALGTSFLPVTGKMPGGELIPGSPAAKLEEAKANRESTQAAVALARQKQQAIEKEAEELRKGTQAATALGRQKLKALEDEARRLRQETSDAVALAQQKMREEERAIADAWKMRGGPVPPPAVARQQSFVGQAFRGGLTSPIDAQTRVESTLKSGELILAKLNKLRQKGVDTSQLELSVNDAINNLVANRGNLSSDLLKSTNDALNIARKTLAVEKESLAVESKAAGSIGAKSEGFAGPLSRQDVRKQISQIVSDFNAAQPGKNVTETFSNQLTGGGSQMRAAASTAFGSVLRAINKVFGIASPSKAMIEIVKNIVSTFVTELISSAPSVKSALENTFGTKNLDLGYEEIGRRNPRGALPSFDIDPNLVNRFEGRRTTGGYLASRGVFATGSTPPIAAPGSGYPFFPPYQMAVNRFPTDLPAELSQGRNRRTDTTRVLSEAIAEYRKAIDNFWSGEDSQFEAITKVVTSSARLSAARLARRLQQTPDPAPAPELTVDQQFRQIATQTRSTIRGQQLSSALSNIRDVVVGDRELGVSRSVGSAVQRISDSVLNSVESLSYSIGNSFEDGIDRIRSGVSNAVSRGLSVAASAVSGLGGGGLPPSGGGGGAAGGGGGQPGDLVEALRLGDLRPIARATGSDLDELAARLAELRNRVDPLSQDFRELTTSLQRLSRETERRDVNANPLTRRFGPRAARGISEGLIGGAFPLLFGQGLGASVGGGVGGALGGFAGGGLGFGLSLIGTALGTAFDTAIQGAKDLGAALKSPVENFATLKERALLSSKAVERQAEALIDAGRAADASALVQEDLAKRLGPATAESLKNLSSASDDLARATAGSTAQLQAFIANMIGLGPILKALAAGANINALQVRAGNTISELRQQGKGAEAAKLEEVYGRTRFTQITPEEYARQLAVALEQAEAKLKPIQVKIDPKDQQRQLDTNIANAEKIRSLRQQGTALERSAQDIRLNIEETIYGFRKRARDMEREGAEFRRSVEDEVFKKRQELERKIIENDRQRRQNAIDAFDLQIQAASSGLDPITKSIIDAGREYIRVRAEGEADLEQKQRQLTLDIQQIEQETGRYRLQIADRISQMTIQREEFARDVAKAKLQNERSILDYAVQVEDYRLQMVKRRYDLEIDLEKKKQIAAQGGLTQAGIGPVSATGKNWANVGGFMGGRQMLHGIPGYAGYDASHAKPTNIHYHFAGKNPAETKAVADYLKGLGYSITEFSPYGQRVGRHARGSQHYSANAFDIPGASMGGPHSQIVEGQRKVHALILDFLAARGGAAQATPAAQAGAVRGAQAEARMAGLPTPPQAPSMAAYPSAPALVQVNDLLGEYLSLQSKMATALRNNNKTDQEALAIRVQAARQRLIEQTLSPIMQYQQQNRELQFEIEKRRIRNRLLMEGMKPEIVDGEIRVLEIQRDLAKTLEGVEQNTNNLVKEELRRVGVSDQAVDATFRLTEATMASLIATTEDTKKQEELRKKLQSILNLRNELAGKAEGAASTAIQGARDIAQQEAEPGRKVREFIAQATTELNDLEAQAIRVSQSIGDNIGSAFQGALMSITGIGNIEERLNLEDEIKRYERLKSSVEQNSEAYDEYNRKLLEARSEMERLRDISGQVRNAFYNMLTGIAEDLARESIKMIATYIAIGIAKAFAFGSSGMSRAASPEGYAVGTGASIEVAAKGAYFNGGVAEFANGGIVSSPTLFKFADGGAMRAGLMGEAGPEAIMPLERGPDGKLGVSATGMRDAILAARGALSGGNSAAPSEAFSDNREALSTVSSLSRERYVERVLSSGASSTEIKYSRVGSGDLPFVTEEDMLQATRLAAQEGARLGQQRTLAALKNNPATRRSVGV